MARHDQKHNAAIAATKKKQWADPAFRDKMLKSRPELDRTEKKCPRCEKTKVACEFRVRPTGTLHSYCLLCEREYGAERSRKYWNAHPEKRGEQQANNRKVTLAKYGITPEDYDALLDIQGGKCGVCGVSESGRKKNTNFCVDHDHVSGRVRGLLCDRCNRALGLLGDNPDTLRSAARYLERARCHKKIRS